MRNIRNNNRSALPRTRKMRYDGSTFVNADGILKLSRGSTYHLHIGSRGRIARVYSLSREWITTIPYKESEWSFPNT